MARNRVGIKGCDWRRIQKGDEDLDESDEEYKVTDDEDSESDELYSLDSDESEEISADFGKSKRVSRSRNNQRTSSGRKLNKIVKPRKRRRVSYTEDDNDDDDGDDEEEEEDADEDDEEFMPTEKKKVSYTELDDDDDDDDDDNGEDYKEFVFHGRNKKQGKKTRDKKSAVYTDHDDDDDDDDNDDDDDYEAVDADVEFMSLDKEANQVNKPMEKKRVSYTDADDGCGDDDDDDYDDGGGVGGDEEEDYTEYAISGRNKKQIKESWEKKRVVYAEDEDEDEDEDADDDEAEDADEDGREFLSKQIRRPTEMKRISYTKLDGDDDDFDDSDEEEDDCQEFVSSGRKRNQRKKPHEKRVVYTEEDEIEDDDDEYIYSSKKVNQKKNLREKRGVSYTKDHDVDDDDDDSVLMSTSKKRNNINKRRDKRIVSYKEDNQEDDDESDAEFKLSESDFVDDEDETPKIKKNKVIRSHPQKKSVRGRQKRSKKSKLKNPSKPKHQNHRSGPKSITNETQMENKISKRRKQKAMAESDSDFVNSASSDHEYTISEEEREQMREARVYCGNLRAKLGRSSCGNQEKQAAAHEQKKYPIRKGKEKIEDIKDDLGKQVCGICLSEEQKRTMRGVLSCCRHYFCFTCIMEWSKVESRCPLCKQRFTTVTKAAKSDTGFDLRTVVIPVPECDQVYEPSEEELRGYLDPYESVICTECQNGGDDALMLLCDLCDSSAHTFCVGLGREVPEGNWYCEGCRPASFGTLNSQHLTPNADRRLGNNASAISSSSPIAGGFDLNELYVPETPMTQQTRVHHEPNPAPTGTIATTLRDRRRIHRQIHHRFLNHNRMNDLVRRSSGISASSSGIRLFGSQLDHARASVSQDDHIFRSTYDSSNFYPRTDQFSVQIQNSNLASADVGLQDEHVSLQEFKIH